MSKISFPSVIMTQESYEWFGRANKKLLEEIDDANLKGSRLGFEVVKLLNPVLARDFENNPQTHFARWVKNRGGELPRIRRRDATISDLINIDKHSQEVRKMEIEKLRWIGFAVLVVVVGGGLFHLITKETKPESLPPKPKKKPDIPTRQETVNSLVIAVAIDAGKLEAQELTSKSLAELVSQSAFYWVGSADEWEGVKQNLALDNLDSRPSTEDALVLVSVQLGSTKPAPTTRVEVSSLLRQAPTKIPEKWEIEEPGRLSEEGFKRR